MLFLATLLSVACSVTSYRYLVVFPVPSGSHSILGKGFVKALTSAGHEVTHITAVPDKDPGPLVEQIDASFLFEQMKNTPNFFASKPTMSFRLVKEMTYNMTTSLLQHDVVQNLIADRSRHYDAVITEWFFSDLYTGFAQVFGCPWIHFAPSGQVASLEYLVDEVQSPALNPSLITGFTVPMSLKERVINTFIVFYDLFETILFDTPVNEAVYVSLFGPGASARGAALAPYSEALHNVSVLLLNSHPALGQTLRLPSNVAQVAGYHIDAEVKPLPKTLQDTLDKATSGAIYFSMGSNLKSADMPESVRKQLLALFQKLKLTVIWKFEAQMDDAPSNVHIASWMPQQSILAHKNVKAFITHGGMLSVTEAVHFGVPLIAVPIYGDQSLNAQRSQRDGFAIVVDYYSESFVDLLGKALQKIISEPSYYERAKTLSRLFHDRPLPAARQVVYWAEHAVRTGGAPHLRSPALRVPAYQRWMLDIAALVTAALAAAILLIRAAILSIRAAVKRLVGKGETKRRSKKNN